MADFRAGECPLPGTSTYTDVVTNHITDGLWHFILHWQQDLPEALTSGKERVYLQHFYDRLSVNQDAFSDADISHYTNLFQLSGAMRAGFELYRGFHQDEKDNKEWVKKHGKSSVASLALNGEGSFLSKLGVPQSQEVFESVEEALIPESGHWIAEENPRGFVDEVSKWVQKHGGNK